MSIALRRTLVSDLDFVIASERADENAPFVDELGAHRLWIDVKDHNTRARHLYESEGFIVEGVLRECIRNGPDFESLVVLSILNDEYQTRLNGVKDANR